MSWMNVYPTLTVEENELQIKQFLPLKVMKITLPVQLMAYAWCIFECLNYCLVIGQWMCLDWVDWLAVSACIWNSAYEFYS